MELQFSSISILLPFLLIVFLFLKRNKHAKTSGSDLNRLPGPWKLPIIGNMHQIVGPLPHHTLRDLSKKYGPLMILQLGEVSNIVVSSADMAKEVMKTHDLIFANRPFILAASILTYDSKDIALSPYGDYWRQLRKICILELMSAKRVQSFQYLREQEVSDLISFLYSRAGSLINLSKKIMSSIYSVTSRAAFGSKSKDQEEFMPLVKEGIELAGGFSVADVFPSCNWLQALNGMGPKIEKIRVKFDRILETIIREHKSRRTNSEDRAAGEPQDLVDVLLDFQENGDLQFPFENDNIKAVILDIFSGGSETTSSTIEWAISEMLRNPRVLRKAQAEVRQVFGQKRAVQETGLEELQFLKLVIRETLRLHPPLALLLPRESSNRCQINGYNLPAKTKVIVNAWAIGRDPAYWNEPEEFLPERFLDNSIDYKGANFEFIPFGAGRRICPGILFGIANVELLLANLLYHFDWKAQDGMKLEDLDMEEHFGVTVRRKRDLYLIPIPYTPECC